MGNTLRDDDHHWVEYAVLLMLRAEPRAAFEVARAYAMVRERLDWPPIHPRSVGRRMSELKAKGFIEETGELARRPDGRWAHVMRVVPGVTLEGRTYHFDEGKRR